MVKAKSVAQSDSGVEIDFILPESESLRALPSTDPEVEDERKEIEIIAQNQKSSSTFEIVVAQPITFEVASSEIERKDQEELKRWAEAKLETLLEGLTLRSGSKFLTRFLLQSFRINQGMRILKFWLKYLITQKHRLLKTP